MPEGASCTTVHVRERPSILNRSDCGNALFSILDRHSRPPGGDRLDPMAFLKAKQKRHHVFSTGRASETPPPALPFGKQRARAEAGRSA